MSWKIAALYITFFIMIGVVAVVVTPHALWALLLTPGYKGMTNCPHCGKLLEDEKC